ncbi:MAG TPA: bifunctional folylpolyglutamate synthase/dihydrofolate synthase, partial [Candidatus Marinimicrobia bacterium]|nr:bifunctional folylpolyglutamate synthase/dihydrofolate synthase [Candidatus Neomarinimicrobiota bacterium]
MTSSNFPSLIDALYRLERRGIKLGLEHTSALLKSIGNPHNELKFIHVAGTNGKGSTCAMIANILRSKGKNVGLFTSPHLVRFNERIRVNGNPISDDEIIHFMEKANPHIEKIESTFFEATTAMAFDYFRNQKVDIAIIETGLGGRLDSTNVINPHLTVITPISMDHMDILGQDLNTIAKEKAG